MLLKAVLLAAVVTFLAKVAPNHAGNVSRVASAALDVLLGVLVGLLGIHGEQDSFL